MIQKIIDNIINKRDINEIERKIQRVISNKYNIPPSVVGFEINEIKNKMLPMNLTQKHYEITIFNRLNSEIYYNELIKGNKVYEILQDFYVNSLVDRN